MPQNEYMERFRKEHGRRLDYEERKRKREARDGHKASEKAQNLRGLRAKLHQQRRHKEKIQMKKAIRAQEERNVKSSAPAAPSTTPLPSYLLDRSDQTNAKALSSAIKNKRAEKAAKFSVPLPKVRGISEEEMFKVVKTGKKTAKKSWKRMITKPTFVGPDFTRRPVKYERFIRPMGLRYKKAHVTHPTLNVSFEEECRFLQGADNLLGHRPASHHQCQEEPSEPAVHATGRVDQGNNHRSQRQRVGHGHSRWQSCLGALGPGHQQPRAGRMSERRLACLSMFMGCIAEGVMDWDRRRKTDRSTKIRNSLKQSLHWLSSYRLLYTLVAQWLCLIVPVVKSFPSSVS